MAKENYDPHKTIKSAIILNGKILSSPCTQKIVWVNKNNVQLYILYETLILHWIPRRMENEK